MEEAGKEKIGPEREGEPDPRVVPDRPQKGKYKGLNVGVFVFDY